MRLKAGIFVILIFMATGCSVDDAGEPPNTRSKSHWRKAVTTTNPGNPTNPDPGNPNLIYDLHSNYQNGYSRTYSSGNSSCSVNTDFMNALYFTSSGACSSGATLADLESKNISRLGSSFTIEVGMGADGGAPFDYNEMIGAIAFRGNGSLQLAIAFYGRDELYVTTGNSGESYYLTNEFVQSRQFKITYADGDLRIFDTSGGSDNQIGYRSINLTNKIDHLYYVLNTDWQWHANHFIIY